MKRTLFALAAGALLAVFPMGASATPTPPEPALPIVGGGEIVAHNIVEYTTAVQIDEIVRYTTAVHDAEVAEAQRVADEAAAAAVRTTNAPSTVSSSRSGGGHSDAWWHGVAICEQGGRNDPYFGYFSFMDGSMGGQPWDVQVAAGNALLASVGSESPAWAPSCVAAGYAASPGG